MAKLLNFLGITYLVGESKVQNLNFRVHWLSEIYKVYLCSHFASTFSRTRFTEMALVDLNPLCCLSVVDHLPWEDIGSVSSASMLWRKTAQSWICSPHIPRSMRFLAPGSTWSFSCELSCEDTDPGKTQDVIFRFMGLSAREAPRLRWLFHAGGQNFDEEDDDRNWGFDDEWPDATGMYLAGYTNRPDFSKTEVAWNYRCCTAAQSWSSISWVARGAQWWGHRGVSRQCPTGHRSWIGHEGSWKRPHPCRAGQRPNS